MVIVDIEASGLNEKESSIVSIGAVDYTNPERQFYAEPRVWDGAKLVDDALAVNGFSKEECVDPNRKSLKEVMEEFYEWLEPIEERTLVGQNVSFDRDYLNDSFSRSSIGWNFSFRTIDVHSVAYYDHIRRGIPVPQEHNRTALNLETIARYTGIPEEPQPHNALSGAKVEAEAIARMFEGKNLLPEFKEFDIPDYLQSK